MAEAVHIENFTIKRNSKGNLTQTSMIIIVLERADAVPIDAGSCFCAIEAGAVIAIVPPVTFFAMQLGCG